MTKNKLYVVTMYRWGERENHSYFIGVFDKKQKAVDAGNAEQEWRGGKYDPEILEADLNFTYFGKNHLSPEEIREIR